MYRPSTTPNKNFYQVDNGPKPLPPFLRLPPPPPSATSLPSVPDVSLIFTPYSSPIQPNFNTNAIHATSAMTSTLTTAPAINVGIPAAKTHDENRQFQHSCSCSSNPLLLELVSLVKNQNTQIQIMQKQIQTLIMSKPIVEKTSAASAHIETQTDVPVPVTRYPRTMVKQPETQKPVDERRDAYSPNNTEDLSRVLKELQLPITTQQSVYSATQSNTPLVDLPDYTDYNPGPLDQENENEGSPGIGPSVSEYGSSSSDEGEEVQPTFTYYRNVLGNVNRLLENNATTTPPNRSHRRSGTNGQGHHGAANGQYDPRGSPQDDPLLRTRPNNNLMIQQNVYNSIFFPNRKYLGADERPEPIPHQMNYNQRQSADRLGRTASDATIYGISSANLSFATRDYLQRHGLVHQNQSTNGYQPQRQRPSNRILDSMLHNQPKFT